MTDPIQNNFDLFEHYLERAQKAYTSGRYDAAAIFAATAAGVAANCHCGIFVSPRLERLLMNIGRKVAGTSFDPAIRRGKPSFRRVLHICTQLSEVGGLTRMIARWIAADARRGNSLLLTQHRGPIPGFVTAAVSASGGQVHLLNRHAGGMIEWAKQLQKYASGYDALILHTHCEDVLPLLAFHEPRQHPPLLFVNHADHIFWLGASNSHIVMSLRDAAVDLCVTRRGIAQERTFLLPTLVDRAERRFTKEEAKLALGIPPEKTVLVSVARAVKYHSVGGVSYAGMHAPVLERHPNAILLAVGPEESDDWRTGSPDVDERIRCIGEVADPRIFFEAGDIYVDSYPFVSSTSMMEAAGYGLPLVTRFDGPDEARIFGINHVGLVGSAIVAHSLQEYQAELSKLILSPDLCQRLGTQAREAIHRYHTPPGWLDFLEALYEKAAELTPNKADAILPEHFEQSHFGEPDCRHHDILGDGFDPRMMMKSYIGMAGLSDRLSLWKEIRRSGAFATLREAARFLMPEWAVRRFKDDFLSRLRAHSGYA